MLSVISFVNFAGEKNLSSSNIGFSQRLSYSSCRVLVALRRGPSPVLLEASRAVVVVRPEHVPTRVHSAGTGVGTLYHRDRDRFPVNESQYQLFTGVSRGARRQL